MRKEDLFQSCKYITKNTTKIAVATFIMANICIVEVAQPISVYAEEFTTGGVKGVQMARSSGTTEATITKVEPLASAKTVTGVFTSDITDYISLDNKSVQKEIVKGTTCTILQQDVSLENRGFKYYKFQLADGTVGYVNTLRLTTNAATVADVSTAQYVKSEVELKSEIGRGKTTDKLLKGEKVNVTKTSGKYSYLKSEDGKKGWVLTSKLTKTMPKTGYVTKNTWTYLYQSGSCKSPYVMTGTKVTILQAYYANGKLSRYQIKTTLGETCYIPGNALTTQEPDQVWTKKEVQVYATASTKGKKVSKLAKGSKITRVFSKGSYYEVTFKVNGKSKTGYVKKSDISFSKVGKALKKSYGTYYTLKEGRAIKKLDSGYKGYGYDPGKYTITEGDLNTDGINHYATGTKVLKVDNYWYDSYGRKKTKKDDRNMYNYIKCQFPDGTVGYLNYYDTVSSKSKLKSATKITECKDKEKEAIAYLNKIRKSKGLSTLSSTNKAAKKMHSNAYTFWKRYGQRYGYSFLTHSEWTPWTNGVYSGLDLRHESECCSNYSKNVSGTIIMKQMIGDTENLDAHGRALLNPDLDSISVVILKQNGRYYVAMNLAHTN